MNERRMSIRNLVHLNVDLYHDDVGHIEGNIRDVSSGGMNVDVLSEVILSTALNQKVFVVKPANMDVLFNMECLRVNGSFISLKFTE